jgi:MFS family permease
MVEGDSAEGNYNLKAIIAISFFAHLLVHTYMVIFPVLIPFIVEEFGVEYLVVGAIYTVSNIAFGFGAIGAGILADKIGSKRLIVACALGMGCSSLLVGITSNLEGLTITLFLLGLSASLYHPASFSLISKATAARGKAFGVHGVGGSLGLAIAPLIGVPVALEWGWRASFIILAIPGIILGLVTIATKLGEEIPRIKRSIPAFRALFTRAFIITLGIYACYGLCFQGVVGFLPAFLTEVGGIVLGGILASTITLAMGAPGQLVGGMLTDRGGTIKFLTMVFALLGVVLVIMAIVPGMLAVLIGFAAGFLIFSSQPGTGTLLAEQTSAQVRGIAYGLAFMANFGVGAFGTSLAGFIADETGSLSYIFPVMACFMGLALILLAVLRWKGGGAPNSS